MNQDLHLYPILTQEVELSIMLPILPEDGGEP